MLRCAPSRQPPHTHQASSACRVFSPAKNQADVFRDVSDMVQSALDGYNVCLFSYGQTGSGKTFTMNGTPSCDTLRGIIPRSVSKILAQTQALRAAGWEFTLEACFIEIYNENLRDLLAEDGGRPGARMLDANAIKHDPSSHTHISGATKIVVDSEEVARQVRKTHSDPARQRQEGTVPLQTHPVCSRTSAGGSCQAAESLSPEH